RQGAVVIVPFHDTTPVKSHDVAFLEPSVRGRDAVHDLLVDGDAHRSREAAVALEGRPGLALAEESLDLLVDFERGHPGLGEARKPVQHVAEDVAGAAHERDLAGRLQVDHAAAPLAAWRSAARIVSMAPSPRTVESSPRLR